MKGFFKVKTPTEVFRILDRLPAVGDEIVDVSRAAGRVLFEDVTAPEDLPHFARSTVDGFAVRARDTFGATESLPALLNLVGEVRMGEAPGHPIAGGEAIKIPTGGMLPPGADGVVMKEYSHALDATTLEVNRAISPLENVIQPGDDFRRGERILFRGRRLRPQDVGALAGLGITRVRVHGRPRVAILSSGDEIVPAEASPRPGQVRDINRHTLQAFCAQNGAVALFGGLVPDAFETLRRHVVDALAQADTVWLSGGSSVGSRDLSLKVFETLPEFELLVHGISISPGKPTIIACTGSKPLVGLPGHVASAMVVAEVFLSRLLARLGGVTAASGDHAGEIEAELSRNIPSASGRDDYIRVKLSNRDGTLFADPLFGKSGLISTLVASDGLVRIDRHTEGLYAGQRVRVRLF